MRIIAFDLETTSLSAMIGRVLCCSFCEIVPDSGPAFTFRGDAKQFRSKDLANDKPLVAAIYETLCKYDVWVAHNGKSFDRRFLNARLIKHNLEPLPPKLFIDTCRVIRAHCRISAKLQYARDFLGLAEDKTPISWDVWQRGAAYDKKSMDEICKHCEQDVKVLRQAYWRLLPLIRQVSRA